MLNIYYSTQLEDLTDKLLQNLDSNPREDLLQPEIFVVQNHGIGQWLSLQMAQKQGISANLTFEFPSERIWSLIRLMDDEIPETLPSDRGPMTWTLMELLQDRKVLNDFENLEYYIQDSDPQQQVLRSWKLSSKIADVFDQYLVYRPDMILGWEERKLQTSQQSEQWQLQLWNRLVDHWEKHHDESTIHRARLQQKLLDDLKNNKLNTDELPERISVFGVSSLPPISIEILAELSSLFPVHFYQLSVDPQIRQSVEFQNPLLQSLGKEGSSFMSLLSDRASTDYEGVNNEVEGGSGSVFQEVQSDLKQDLVPSDSALHVPAVDDSIQLHSCHSPMREVEVLYDQLLAVLDKNPDLNPDDILIMTPDIETYAPMIEAVFEVPKEGQPAIPYSIADRGIAGDRPTVQSFLKILELCESRFKVTDVLDLLDANPIQEAFQLSDGDLNRLEQWIRDNRIRWGIDGNFKQEMDLPESDHFTWKSGLNRMLLGYAMNPGDDQLFGDIFPYKEIETSDDAALVGRFSRLLQSLFQAHRLVKKDKSVSEWEKELGQVLKQFLPDNRDRYWEISTIREALSTLSDQVNLAAFHGDIPFQIVRLWLQKQLKEQATGGGQLGRGVTFSSLMPMRSIPFKMIGMIGMDEGAFPRSNIPIEFDLMHLEPKDGDPIQAEEDRYLFLENLISARSHLYVSYVGQSNSQDTDFPPSVIVSEFLDYLEHCYGLSASEIVTEHRLQSFSPKYFTDDQLFTYSQSRKKIAQQLTSNNVKPNQFIDSALPTPEDEWKNVSMLDLISFFQHPAKFLLQNRLGIFLREEEVLTEDRELFALERLDKYYVEQVLLERFLKDRPLEDYDHVMQSRDLLPEGWTGKQAYQQKALEAQEFGKAIQQQLNEQQLEDCEINITVDGFHISGMLGNLFRDVQLMYRFGKARAKDKIDFWIRHLLLQQSKPQGHPGKSMMLSWDDTTLHELQLGPVDDAEAILADLLNWYWQGLRRPLHFYCKSSYTFADNVLNNEKGEDEGIQKARNKWESGYNYTGEEEDPYNRLITDRKPPLTDPHFKEVSRAFWAPFFQALNQEEA